jgi:hypothetical protein
MNWTAISDKLLDPYDVRARLFPGLLILLPAILYLALLHGTKSPLVVGLSSVLVACGGPYLLSSFVRTWGQRAQDRLFRRWGASPSTVLLRHRDETLPAPTKRRYHELAATRLGIQMPSVEAEQGNPGEADQAYAAAADALRPLTNDRKAFPFVFKELVAYGFNRNAYGSRWVGLCVAAGALIATLLHANALRTVQPFVNASALDVAHAVVLVSASAMAVLWCAHFTAETVKLAGIGYAKRLWEALEKIPKKALRPQRKAQAVAEVGEAAVRP